MSQTVGRLCIMLAATALVACGSPTTGDGSCAGSTPDSQISSGDQVFWVEQLAEGLKYPSSMVWLPNGDVLVLERRGGLRIMRGDLFDPRPVSGTPEAYRLGLNGLKDIVLDPDFATNSTLYLSISEGTYEGNHAAVYRARYSETGLENVERIFRSKDEIIGSGSAAGRLLFLADNTLLFAVPENDSYKTRAQLLTSHIGKIVRINRDGSVPADNPFVDTSDALPEIYTYGNRTPLGLYQDPQTGDVFEVEGGPAGGDELNLLKAGGNYGWAQASWGFDYTGGLAAPSQMAKGIESPLLVWTPSVTPSGLTRYHGTTYPLWNGDYFVGHLTTAQLVRLRIVDHRVVLQEALLVDLNERIRDVRVGPDNHIYILTDHQNGRVLRLQPGTPDEQQLERVARKLEQPPYHFDEKVPGDAANGKQAFLDYCSACHGVGTLIRGGETGPDLAGVFGRNIGTLEDFAYSAAMGDSPQVWSELALGLFLAGPSQYMPGTSMASPPVSDPEVRRDLVAFLKEQSVD